MVARFSGLTNIPGKTIISPLPDPPPEPLDFYKDTTTNRITSPSTSFTTAIPGSVVEDDLMVLYHVTSDDVTQTIVNPVLLTIVNPGGELFNTGWTTELGAFSTRTNSPSPFEGSRYFFGGAASQTRARQDITVPANLITEIDAGSLTANLKWRQNSFSGSDQAEMEIEFRDGLPGNIIGAKVAAGLSSPSGAWQARTLSVVAPALTRTIRIFYHGVRQSGSNLDGDIDAITLDLTGSTTVGWVSLWKNVQVSDECTTSCYTKLAGASEPSTVTVGSLTSEQHVTIISNFGGVDTTNPVNAFNNASNGSASTTVIAPSVTTTQGSTMLYTLGAGGGYAEGGDLEPDHYSFSGGVTKRTERVVSMDGQKSTKDFSVNNFPITFVNNAQLDTAFKQSGIASLDMSIFSNSQRVTVPDSPFWDLGTADFTLEAHINLIGDNNFTGIISRGSTNNNSKWGFATDTSGRLRFSNNIFFTLQSPTSLTNTGWHHVACSRVSGVFRIFIDGILSVSSGTFRNIGTLNFSLFIGRDPEQVNRVFDGHIDNVHVATGNGGGGRYAANFTPPSGLPIADSFTRLLIPFDDPLLPFGCKGAVGTEFIPFATTTGSRTMIQDKAQAAQSGTVAIARQL